MLFNFDMLIIIASRIQWWSWECAVLRVLICHWIPTSVAGRQRPGHARTEASEDAIGDDREIPVTLHSPLPRCWYLWLKLIYRRIGQNSRARRLDPLSWHLDGLLQQPAVDLSGNKKQAYPCALFLSCAGVRKDSRKPKITCYSGVCIRRRGWGGRRLNVVRCELKIGIFIKNIIPIYKTEITRRPLQIVYTAITNKKSAWMIGKYSTNIAAKKIGEIKW